MVSRQVPTAAIFIDIQSVAGREVPLEHLPTPAAIQANHVVPVNGSPHRNSGCALAGRFGRWFTESPERLIDGRDHGGKLV